MSAPPGAENAGYRWSLEYFTRYVRENREELATVIWKDTPPQHFDYENGYYWYISHGLHGMHVQIDT